MSNSASVPKKPSRTGIRHAGLILQARDRRVFSELVLTRLLTCLLAVRLSLFSSRKRASDRLNRLVAAGYLRRFYFGTAAHGRMAIYALSHKGATTVGAPAPAYRYRQGQLLAAEQVQHQLHISGVYLAFRSGVLPQGARFVRWLSFYRAVAEHIPLIPDGYCEVEVGLAIRCMFIEVDLGSEALRIWEEKTRNYLRLAISGEFTRIFHQQQFRVLVLAASQRRLANIRRVVAESTEKLFWFATFDDINRDGAAGSIWLRPKGETLLPLF